MWRTECKYVRREQLTRRGGKSGRVNAPKKERRVHVRVRRSAREGISLDKWTASVALEGRAGVCTTDTD